MIRSSLLPHNNIASSAAVVDSPELLKKEMKTKRHQDHDDMTKV